jgi:phage shock protein PspC (stress-responsive transcriptional regulator)
MPLMTQMRDASLLAGVVAGVAGVLAGEAGVLAGVADHHFAEIIAVTDAGSTPAKVIQ